MASKKSELKAPQLPEGFKPLALDKLAGYFVRKQGNTAQGIYLGSFESKGGKFGPGIVHRVKLTVAGTIVENKDQPDAPANVDDIIGINQTGWTKKLSTVGEGQEVYLLCEGKKGAGQQDPWVFQIAIRE